MNPPVSKSSYLIPAIVSLLLVAASPLISSAAANDGFWLVTSADIHQFAKKGGAKEFEFFEKSFGAPKITLLSPELEDKTVRSPMTIELTFQAHTDAKIVPESLRILYGMFKIDVTERMLEHATLTDNRIVADNAKLPIGEHDILLEISDSEGRKGRKKLSLLVVE